MYLFQAHSQAANTFLYLPMNLSRAVPDAPRNTRPAAPEPVSAACRQHLEQGNENDVCQVERQPRSHDPK